MIKNLGEPSNQALLLRLVFAEYLRYGSPQTPSKAIRAILTKSGGKLIKAEGRCTKAYG